MIGGCVLLCVARTQTLVSWSSAEAEFYGSVSGAAEALHFQKLLEFLRWQLRITLHSDSSGAIAIAQRLGVGSVKTTETKTLWLQERLRQKLLHTVKVAGKINVADVGTKMLKPPTFFEHCKRLGLRHARCGGELRQIGG
jgi:hypothetical protein